jgi:hypothetical protein
MCEPVSMSTLALTAAGAVGSAALAGAMSPKMPGAPQAPAAAPASQALQAAKTPDESARRRATPAMGAATALTGPSGIDMSGLALGRNSLLGL